MDAHAARETATDADPPLNGANTHCTNTHSYRNASSIKLIVQSNGAPKEEVVGSFGGFSRFGFFCFLEC